MAGKKFPIGKILYILSNKKQRVIPVIVVEENHRKVRKPDGTLHEVMNYKVTLGPSEQQRVTVDISKIDGEVFESIEEIQNLLRERLETFLSELVQQAKKQVQEWYGVTPGSDVVDSTDSLEGEGSKFDPEDLLNGKTLAEPTESGSHPLQMNNTGQTVLAQPTLRDHIKKMVSPDGEANPTIEPGKRYVVLETGERVLVDW